MADLTLRPTQIGNLQIEKPDQIEWINFIIYGDSGAGKTTLAASACAVEEMCPVLLVDAEAGTLSIRNKYPEIDVIRLSHYGELVQIRDAIQKGTVPYKTVILDSITEMSKIGMDDIMVRAVHTAHQKGETRDPDLPGIGEWGKSSNQVRKLVRAFKLLPIHFITTALAQVDTSKPSKVVTKPALSGKLATELPGQFDEVFYMYKKDDKIPDSEEVITNRYILTDAYNNTFAKDRSTNLPQVLKNPTMQNIFDIITSDNSTESDTDNG